MRRYFYLLMVLLATATTWAQKTTSFTKNGLVYKLTIDTMDHCHVTAITIQKTNGTLLQTITPDENYSRCDIDSADDQSFAVEDMNFDGHDDMRLLTIMSGTGHNLNYYYWMYDTMKHEFVSDTLFNDITEPHFNAGNHTITSCYSQGNAGSGSQIYELYKGKLRLISTTESVANDYTGDYMENSCDYIYINGKRVVKNSVTTTFEEDTKIITYTSKKRVKDKLLITITREKAVKSKY